MELKQESGGNQPMPGTHGILTVEEDPLGLQDWIIAHIQSASHALLRVIYAFMQPYFRD